MWPIPGMGAGYGSEQVGLSRGGARLQAGGLDSPLGAELIQGVELALGAGPEWPEASALSTSPGCGLRVRVRPP